MTSATFSPTSICKKCGGARWATIAVAVLLVAAVAIFATPAQAQTYTLLYSFVGESDGQWPLAALAQDGAGNLYGTTAYGGNSACVYGCGTVFKLDATGTETVLYRFSAGDDGWIPMAGVRYWDGNLYGTTAYAGAFGAGTVFKLDLEGNETTLHSFQVADGNIVYGGLIRDAAGNLYGTTELGGSGSNGVVFKLDPSGAETVLYNFTGSADGARPSSSLVRDAEGNLYGTTTNGGNTTCSVGCGTVFRLDAAGHYTVLHHFTGGADGANPSAGLIRDAAGNLYGTAARGGIAGCFAEGCGVVFKVNRAGVYTVLHAFAGGADGGNPIGGLFRDEAGNLYGTAQTGGNSCVPHGCGTVFQVGKLGNFNVLHTFTGAEGAYPQSALIRDQSGNFYGTTTSGGAFNGDGAVFRLTP